MVKDKNKMYDMNAAPSFAQSKSQIERYQLEVDAQAILVASRLIAAGAMLGSAAENHFSKFGLSTGRYRLLADLEDNDGEELPSQLAEHLGITRATVTGLIDILKRDGLVSRRLSPEDGRLKLVTLTEKGKKQLSDMAPEHFAWLESIVNFLSVEERGVFLELLDRIMQGIAASDDSSYD